jgi:hypothetical protein
LIFGAIVHGFQATLGERQSFSVSQMLEYTNEAGGKDKFIMHYIVRESMFRNIYKLSVLEQFLQQTLFDNFQPLLLEQYIQGNGTNMTIDVLCAVAPDKI